MGVYIDKRRAALLASAMMLTVMGLCSMFSDTNEIARFYSNPVLLECIFGLLSYYCVRYLASAAYAGHETGLAHRRNRHDGPVARYRRMANVVPPA